MGIVGNIHLVAGNAEAIPQLLELLKSEGMPVEGNPDVYMREYPRFGIDESRELRDRASLRAVGKRRVFIVVTSGITNEAQNALLKTLEEPPADAVFIFVVSSPQMLLPTFRSRAQMLYLQNSVRVESLVDAKAFLIASPQKRIDMLKPLLEKDDDDKRNIGIIIEFLSSLERQLVSAKRHDGIAAIYRARRYMGDKGALVKPLLEQVALLVPHV